MIFFNHRYCDEDKLPKGGSYMHTLGLEDMTAPEPGKCNFIQMTNADYRMTKDTKDESKWNGCTYEDIDYKKWMADNEDALDPETVMGNVVQWLMIHCLDIIYYYEMSRSGKGFHFIFYFNVPKTEHCRNMCKAVTVWAIKKAFHACGYGDIIEYKGVWDDCTNSIYQACFITKNMSNINKRCTGEVMSIIKCNESAIKSQYDELFLEKKANKHIDNLDKDDFLVDWSRTDEKSKINEYLSHTERWMVFQSLSGLCGSDEHKLKEEWEYCASRMVEQNGHTTEYYKEVPWSLDWNDNRTGNEYINRELLSKFGYTITIIRKTNSKGNNIDYFKNMLFL